MPADALVRASDTICSVYAACPLTHVPAEDLPQLKAELAVIAEAVADVGIAEDLPIVTYDPITHTPPFEARGALYTPEQVWRIDSGFVMEEADALIAHLYNGGSAGVGIEILMAALRGIPILVVYDDETPLSRMVEGMSCDITPVRFPAGDLDALRSAVTNWVRLKRIRIERGPARRAAESQLFRDLHAELRRAWIELQQDEELLRETLSMTSLTPRSAEEFLSSPLRVAHAPALTLLLLGEALDVPTALYLTRAIRTRPLSVQEQQALSNAVIENDWGHEFAEVLEHVARAKKWKAEQDAKDDQLVARLWFGYDLTDPAAWTSLAEDWIHDRLP